MKTINKYAVAIGIICATFEISSQINKEIPWVKEKDKNGIAVYMREYKGSDIKEVKAQTIIKAPLNKVKESILNINSYPQWVFSYKNTKILESKGDNGTVYYTEINMSGPVSNRDVVLKTDIEQNTELIFISREKALLNYIPEKKGLVRMKIFDSMFKLEKINENETRVTSQLHTEPAGKIPSWVVNFMLTNGPYTTLKNLRENLTK